MYETVKWKDEIHKQIMLCKFQFNGHKHFLLDDNLRTNRLSEKNRSS